MLCGYWIQYNYKSNTTKNSDYCKYKKQEIRLAHLSTPLINTAKSPAGFRWTFF